MIVMLLLGCLSYACMYAEMVCLVSYDVPQREKEPGERYTILSGSIGCMHYIWDHNEVWYLVFAWVDSSSLCGNRYALGHTLNVTLMLSCSTIQKLMVSNTVYTMSWHMLSWDELYVSDSEHETVSYTQHTCTHGCMHAHNIYCTLQCQWIPQWQTVLIV